MDEKIDTSTGLSSEPPPIPGVCFFLKLSLSFFLRLIVAVLAHWIVVFSVSWVFQISKLSDYEKRDEDGSQENDELVSKRAKLQEHLDSGNSIVLKK